MIHFCCVYARFTNLGVTRAAVIPDITPDEDTVVAGFRVFAVSTPSMSDEELHALERGHAPMVDEEAL